MDTSQKVNRLEKKAKPFTLVDSSIILADTDPTGDFKSELFEAQCGALRSLRSQRVHVTPAVALEVKFKLSPHHTNSRVRQGIHLLEQLIPYDEPDQNRDFYHTVFKKGVSDVGLSVAARSRKTPLSAVDVDLCAHALYESKNQDIIVATKDHCMADTLCYVFALTAKARTDLGWADTMLYLAKSPDEIMRYIDEMHLIHKITQLHETFKDPARRWREYRHAFRKTWTRENQRLYSQGEVKCA